jgi:hypothetical protein
VFLSFSLKIHTSHVLPVRGPSQPRVRPELQRKGPTRRSEQTA